MAKQIPDEMLSQVAFALSCYLEDLEKEIKKHEKTAGQQPYVRANHAKLQRWLLTELIPQSLCGELKLLDGTTIHPQESAA